MLGKLSLLCLLMLHSLAWCADFSEDWKSVQLALDNRQAKTAVSRLKPLETKAIQQAAWDHAVKALLIRVRLENGLAFSGTLYELEGTDVFERPAENEDPFANPPSDPDGFEGGLSGCVVQLDQEIPKAPAKIRPILRWFQARMLLSYALEKHRDIENLEKVPQNVGDPIERWNADTITAAIETRFRQALEDPALRTTPVADYRGCLSAAGAYGDSIRPTLYDLVAHSYIESLTYLSLKNMYLWKSRYLKTSMPVFDDAAAFLAWQPVAQNPQPWEQRVIRVYQDLMTFHRDDPDRSAWLHADLERLRWAGRYADGNDGQQKFLQALQRFIRENAGHPLSADARQEEFIILGAEERLEEAMASIKAGAAAFPQHPSGKLCQAMIDQMMAPRFSFDGVGSWTSLGDEIEVNHHNVKHLWFRLYRLDWLPTLEEPNPPSLDRDRAKLLKLMEKTPDVTWDLALEQPKPYQSATTVVDTPHHLTPGIYHLVVSDHKDFSEKALIDETAIRVTNLTIVDHNLVVDAETGAPKKDVAVEIWQSKPEQKTITRTDAEGRFEIPAYDNDRTCLIIAKDGNDFTYDHNAHSYRSGSRDPVQPEAVTFFTDRSIYRPGQTIQFKGILSHADQENAAYHTIAGRKLKVELTGPNGDKVGERECTTNGFGSFSGTFTAPIKSLTGSFSIKVGDLGSTDVSVEEYKRPQFEVILDPIEDNLKIGDRVKIRGVAKSYAGAPISHAKVVWEAERSMYFSGLGAWYGWNEDGFESQPLAAGETVTAADGSFTLEITADPDLRIPADKEPIFHYYLTLGVTDHGGESQSAELSFDAAHAAFTAEMSVDEWQEVGKPVMATVETSTPGYKPFPATGTLRVYPLIQPAVCPREYGSSPMEFSPRHTELTGPRGWEKGPLLRELTVTTQTVEEECKALIPIDLPVGCYRLEYEAFDPQKKKVVALAFAQVIDPKASHFSAKTPFYAATSSLSRKVGQTIEVVWGSGYESACAMIEWRRDGVMLKREWSTPGRTQQVFRYELGESARGGVTVRVSQYSRNRSHHWHAEFEIPFEDKEFIIGWEKISTQLKPGERDTWIATISRKDGKPVTAEMVATLYDASLDELRSHDFSDLSRRLRTSYASSDYSSYSHDSLSVYGSTLYADDLAEPLIEHPFRMPLHELDDFVELQNISLSQISRSLKYNSWSEFTTFEADMIDFYEPPELPNSVGGFGGFGSFPVTPATPVSHYYGTNLPKAVDAVVSRRKLEETAFFYPHLQPDADGKVRITFTMPEGLGKWRFLGFAHDTTLRSGSIEGETITAKDLMVQPNPPRFLREGDELDFTVRVSNLSEQPQQGIARLTLTDAVDHKERSTALGVDKGEQEFVLAAKESRTLSWKLRVPENCGSLRYDIRAASGEHSDGEEGVLAVLPRRIPVSDVMALSLRDATEIKRDFPSLRASAQSDTLRHGSLRVQVVSRPVWYAIMALPYLMEFPHECAEQTFSRYYANAMAHQLLQSDPEMSRVFAEWRKGKTLDSPLEKNQELANLLLEETPWLRDAADDATRRKNLALLFDENRIQQESAQVLKKLEDMQQYSGMWPWFPEGEGAPFITAHIVAGFGELRAAGVAVNLNPVMKAIQAMDRDLVYRYNRFKKEEREKNHLDPLIVHYLYSRSFFLEDRPIDDETRTAYDYYLQQVNTHWNKLDSRLTTAQAAQVLWRNGLQDTARLIMRAFRETAVRKKEIGMYWPNVTGTAWWWNAPVESQAQMISAFAEIDPDAKLIQDCRDWLIHQRRQGDWGSTTATTAAVRSLLTGPGGKEMLADKELALVALAGKTLVPSDVEAGTGFYEVSIPAQEIKAEMADLTMSKKSPGMAWASVHWQYFEDVAKVAAHGASGLSIEKKLMVRKAAAGAAVSEIKGPLEPGDEIITRLIITTDRDLEFLHLKDQRSSGTEPANVLSGRRWLGSIHAYESTRDAASHFYIDSLPKGIHVIEHSARVQHAGTYQSGVATITCMYAPEFQARSASIAIEVKPMTGP